MNGKLLVNELDSGTHRRRRRKMNIKAEQIIIERLKQDGFDGLFNPQNECACTINDGIAPCSGILTECEAGYEISGSGEYEGTFEVVRNKEMVDHRIKGIKNE